MTKNGYDLVPYVNNFFPPELNMLKFYAEIYQAKTIFQDNGFLISYYLEVYETKITVDKYKVVSKQTCKRLTKVLERLDAPAARMPADDYNALTTLCERLNAIVADMTPESPDVETDDTDYER